MNIHSRTHRFMRCIDADKQSAKSPFATLGVTWAEMTKPVSIYHSPSVYYLLYWWLQLPHRETERLCVSCVTKPLSLPCVLQSAGQKPHQLHWRWSLQSSERLRSAVSIWSHVIHPAPPCVIPLKHLVKLRHCFSLLITITNTYI